MLSACGGFENKTNAEAEKNQTTTQRGHLRMTERSELPTMDPALASDTVSFNALNNVMEGLYRQGPDNQLVLGLAAEEPFISNNGKTYTFHLREDATWSNGEPITADDFVFAWRRAVNPETNAPYRHLFSNIVKNASDINDGKTKPSELGVYAESSKTLIIELERPYANFENLLTLPIFFPLNQEFVEETGKAFGTTDSTVLSNGPFELTHWNSTGSQWKYEKNRQYWDTEEVSLEKVTVDVVKGSSLALERYENKEIDWIPATGEILSEFRRQEEIDEYPTSSIVYIKFNLMRNGNESPLKNASIRKALALVVDKNRLISRLENEAEPAGGLVPLGVATNPMTQEDFRKENGTFLYQNIDEAKRLFHKGLNELKQDKLKLELIGDDTESAIETLKFLQKVWMDAFPELQVTIESMPFSQRLKKDAAEDYDIQLSGWAADYSDPMNFLDIWESTSPQNHSNFSNEEFDHLIQQAKTTTNKSLRWELLLEAERLLLEKGVVAPLYQPYSAFLSKPNVRDVMIHPTGASLSLKWASIAE